MAQSQRRRPKILVVDDDLEVLAVAGRILEAEGYTVLNASNGRDALRLLNAHPDVAILFTDIVMPGSMDGFDLAEAAKTRQPRLRVVYTSAYLRQEGIWDGALLPKPWTTDDLKQVIAELCPPPRRDGASKRG